MKKVIELLDSVWQSLDSLLMRTDTYSRGYISESMRLINSFIDRLEKTRLEKSRWYTPEQWEKRTGKAWPDDWAVYCRYRSNGDELQCHWRATEYYLIKNEEFWLDQKQIVCATEAGPPPDDWRPEEDNR